MPYELDVAPAASAVRINPSDATGFASHLPGTYPYHSAVTSNSVAIAVRRMYGATTEYLHLALRFNA